MRIRRVIQALRIAAQDIINAGQKVFGNSQKLAAAFQDAVVNISAVVTEGIVDVGADIVGVSVSLTKAAQILERAKAAADNVDEGFGEALQELQNASNLVVEAGQTFEEVGKRSLTLVQRIVKLGKDLEQVFVDAARKIFNAAGFTGKK